jgi:phenylalanyl-tRNA synthetase beta subunit
MRKSKSGKVYYNLIDEKRVNGKVVQKYVGYLGKDLNSKREVAFRDVLPYVTRLMDLEITDADIHHILKKIGINADITPITKIVLENDRKLKRTFLRIR